MTSSRDARARARRALVALTVVTLGVVLPVRTAWSAPEVRLDEIATVPGRVVDLPHPSSHLGVRWIGEETDELVLRWRAASGEWSAWQVAEASHDLGDDERDIRLSGLAVADDAVQAEVRVQAGAPRSIEVVAIDTEHGPRRLVVSDPPDASAAVGAEKMPQPAVISRSEWGADESLRGADPPSFATIERAFVHHTASAEGPDPAATVRAIYAYHTQSNGWNDIGYNFLVDSRGRIYEGRYARDYGGAMPTGEDVDGRGVIGAHVAGWNTGSVGIALLGDFTSAVPSDASLGALTRMLAWKADRHDFDPMTQIFGHRDKGSTACPGGNLYTKLPSIRTTVNNMVEAAHAKWVTSGYWVLGRDASLYTFGDAPFLGGPGEIPTPAASMATAVDGEGYWLLSANGRITPKGTARFFGSTEGMRLNQPVVRIEPTPTGRGYWVLALDGGVFSYGDAAFHGSTGAMRLNAPVISMSSTPTGGGYWLLAADGGVFSFGDARFYGSTGAMRLNAPVKSMTPHPEGRGYWLQAADGGIFSFGDVAFHGSVPGLGLRTSNTIQIRSTPTGRGYYVMAADGGIFTFGDARFHGAKPGLAGPTAAIDLALRFGPNPDATG